MSASHPLDRPAWSALTTEWAGLAVGTPGASLRLDPSYGPFAGTVDGSAGALAGLAALAAADPHELWTLEPNEAAAIAMTPPGLSVRSRAVVNQMVVEKLWPQGRPLDTPILPLGETDSPEMLALATLTKPGPFAARTHRLGDFVGLRRDGRLAAMAGERLRLPGFTEVSGVCTHPDHRGRGYAAGLMRRVVAAILARGETAFLHVYAANGGAIALYESLGFRLRRSVILTVLKPTEPEQP
jgi:predicted GNAT family acetyltransferase